ncbi:MAG: quinone oxidoreductase family protein [Inquilinaceae bacterium]
MTKAIVMHEKGGPEVLQWEDVDVGQPGAGQARVRHTAVGLNYIDVYVRTGAYPLLDCPGTPGLEAAGVVEAVGEDVRHVGPGDRVAYAGGGVGSYAEARVMPASVLVKVPDAIDDRTAAAMMLKGMTAEYLLHRTHEVVPGDTILIHAAAGGVGLILSQWAKHIGATVIGTVGSEAKAARARAHGCDHVLVTSGQDFVEPVKELTNGRGVAVVYDGVGKDTFLGSVECLATRGHVVLFGAASGPPEPFDLARLGAKSASVTRPTLFHYIAERPDLEQVAANLMDAVAGGVVTIDIGQTYPLSEAAQAHRDLEARKTTGSTVLLP